MLNKLEEKYSKLIEDFEKYNKETIQELEDCEFSVSDYVGSHVNDAYALGEKHATYFNNREFLEELHKLNKYKRVDELYVIMLSEHSTSADKLKAAELIIDTLQPMLNDTIQTKQGSDTDQDSHEGNQQ